jgi:hypothetical protein
MNYDNFSTEEIKTFLALWGTGFKSLIGSKYETAEAYYQACVDAHNALSGKPLRFFTLAGLRRTLHIIAQDFLVEYTSKRQDVTYKQRSELCAYIAEKLLITPTVVVQKELF